VILLKEIGVEKPKWIGQYWVEVKKMMSVSSCHYCGKRIARMDWYVRLVSGSKYLNFHIDCAEMFAKELLKVLKEAREK